MRTDSKRLQQIIKNLLSNAFKFTEKGEVSLTIEPATSGWTRENTVLDNAPQVLAFSVHDSGIGIPLDKQQIIFEAFQQADGSTNRKYGGTGLGLAISREIARLLGGEIKLISSPGQGSTFILYVPLNYTRPEVRKDISNDRTSVPAPAFILRDETPASSDGVPVAEVQDDREYIQEDDRVLLIVEDDPAFSSVLLQAAHEKNFKGIVASRGSDALELARRHRIDAITLDLRLPDIDGWRVLSRLKDDPATRHIPVQILSADETTDLGLKNGAISHLMKPIQPERLEEMLSSLVNFVSRPVKNLLVVEDNELQRQNTVELIGGEGVNTWAVGSGREGLEALRAQHFDCVVLDLGLPDMSGAEFIDEVKKAGFGNLPIVVHTAKDLHRDEAQEIKRIARTVILKDVQSPERLFDETALFLHRPISSLSEDKKKLVESLHRNDDVLAGKKVLIVDDDMRNIFAMTSFLERYSMEILSTESGAEAIEMLKQDSSIDVVLMDIMMPDLDGYETMRRIRLEETFADLPIIALTAKAMKGDREKCIEAGASDYIAKPVDTEHLLSLLRIWLHR
jgi:CheY-like chemotaxis protein